MGRARSPRPWLEPVLVAAVGLVLVLVLWRIWGRFLPAANGRIGIDYALFLPLLLNGFYWFQANGPFAVPWFTPAFCGGLPMYPDPQSVYYSVPQLLTLLGDPLRAVQATFLLFAALGFMGTYLLLRRRFATGMAVALFGATVFLFNSAYPARMVIGHLPYHSLALTPLIAFCLLRPLSADATWMPRIVGAVGAGLLLAYVLQSGNVHLIVPMGLAVAVIGLVHGLYGGRTVRFLAGLGVAVAVAGATSASKLVAAASFLAAAPRAGYPLPGAEHLGALIGMALRLLFIGPADGLYRSVFVNVRWALERYELEAGVTIVPAVVLALAAGAWLVRWLRRPRMADRGRLWLLAAVVFLLAVPIAVNVYTPEWNAVLKRIPVIKNSSTLIRWLFAYVPVFAVIAALALDRRGPAAARNGVAALAGNGVAALTGNGVAALGIILVVAINLQADHGFYANQKYLPRTILAAYTQAVETRRAPPVNELVVYVDREGRIRLPIGRNDAMAEGRSALLCLAPIFGYRLEWLPRGPLPGPTFQETGGRLNLFDPACFVFPDANGCRPGDRFAAGRTKDAGAFVQYRPYPFRFSGAQFVANAVNLAALVAVVGFFGFCGWSRLARRRRGPPGLEGPSP